MVKNSVAFKFLRIAALFAIVAVPVDLSAAVISQDTEIVIDPKAPATVKFAASELSSLLSEVFGAKPKTVSSPTPARGHIYLGDSGWAASAGIAVKDLERDAFIMKCSGGDVYIAGRDDADADPVRLLDRGVWAQHYERATVFGVYEFLERYAGVRMYFPGPLGTITPRCRSFKVPDGLDETVRPAFTVRHYSTYTDGEYFEGPKMVKINPRKNLNAIRLRMDTADIPCCHGQTHMQLLERFGDTHPEYFMMQKGKRRTDPSVNHPGIICLTSGVWNEIGKDCEAYLTGESRGYKWGSCFKYGKYCDVMCQDGLMRCECENCRRSLGTGRYWASELVWSNTCAIARRLSSKGIPGYLTQMAYTSYKGIPKTVDIPGNVLVMLAQRGPWTMHEPRTFKSDFAELKAWVEKMHGHKLWMWTYINKYRFLNLPDIPTITPRVVGEYFKAVQPYVFGAYAESEGDKFLYNHLNYAMFSRICWHPETDVGAWLDEYYRLMYGAAAAEIKVAFGIFEDKWTREIANATVEMPDGPLANPPCEHFIWHEVYSPAVIDGLERLFDRAAAKVSANSIEGQRVALMRRELFEPLARRARKYIEDSVPAATATGAGPFAIGSSDGDSVHRDFALDGRDSRFPRIEPFRRYRLSFNVALENVVPTNRGGGTVVRIRDGGLTSFPTFTAYNGTFGRTRKVFEYFSGPETNRRGKRAILSLSIYSATGRAVYDDVRIEEIPARPEDAKPVSSAVAVPVEEGWRLEVHVDKGVMLRHHFSSRVPSGFFVIRDSAGKTRKLRSDNYDQNANPGIMTLTVKRSQLAEDAKSVTFELITSRGRLLDFADIDLVERTSK